MDEQSHLRFVFNEIAIFGLVERLPGTLGFGNSTLFSKCVESDELCRMAIAFMGLEGMECNSSVEK